MATDDTTRVTNRFALFPIRLDDGTWLWLRWYRQTEALEIDESGWAQALWLPRTRERWPHRIDTKAG